MIKRLVAVSACALWVATQAGCRTASDPVSAPQPPTVTVVTPQRADAIATITLPGDLVGFYEAALHAKVTGYLKSISVDKGDWVKAGQVLAEIEVPELRQKLQRARASLEVQRVTYQRLKHVWDTDRRLVAREDVDVAEGKLDEAKAEVDELETMVGYTRIIAPFDGVVTGRFVDPGALIEARGGKFEPTESSSGGGTSAPVVTVAEISKLRVYIYVPEREVSLIRRGMQATITLKEFPGRVFTGTVTRFATSLDLSTRTMLTEVDLNNPKHELYPGMYADVSLELARHRNALELPPTAVGAAPDGDYVYVVRNDALIRAPVQLGISTGRSVEIISGVSASDEVVSNVSPALAAGESVRSVRLGSNSIDDGRHPPTVAISQ